METTIQGMSESSEDVFEQTAEINKEAHRKGIKYEEMVKFYSEWAKRGDYDKNLSPERYRGPEYAAEALAEQVPHLQRSSYNILDIGAGTGFVGVQLCHRGFCEVDALEPAEGMVEVALAKSIYKKLHCFGLGPDPTVIPQDTYDAAICSGAFGEGHVPCNALKEFIRLVKPGGLVVIMMRQRYLEEVDEYRDRLEPYMEKLRSSGAWSRIKREIKPKYSWDNDGVLFIYKVNISGTVVVNC